MFFQFAKLRISERITKFILIFPSGSNFNAVKVTNKRANNKIYFDFSERK